MDRNRRMTALLLAALFSALALAGSLGENAPTITIISPDGTQQEQAPSSLDILGEDWGADSSGEAAAGPEQLSQAREEFIDRIIALAQQKFDEAKGRAQRAQYSEDIYVCKNFTVYLFRENSGGFRMAEYPDVPLVIPDNQKKEDCKPYVYGVEWKDVPASAGNPFEAAASFRYDETLTKEENRQKAREFLMQTKRGDYFQMAAKYYYGVGAHSLVFTADYDPATDTLRWTDSNMKGKKVGEERYGYVQFDAVKEVDWFVDAFCRKSYGATLYRLRQDLIPTP
ncbi:MAG: hypothetical protein VB099_14785 [Candidatus Limiplasma sp.]|nr:hypothetical protein [Candidatus Limiplasma sp.]